MKEKEALTQTYSRIFCFRIESCIKSVFQKYKNIFGQNTVFLTTHTGVEMCKGVANIILKRQKNTVDMKHSPVGYTILAF